MPIRGVARLVVVGVPLGVLLVATMAIGCGGGLRRVSAGRLDGVSRVTPVQTVGERASILLDAPPALRFRRASVPEPPGEDVPQTVTPQSPDEDDLDIFVTNSWVGTPIRDILDDISIDTGLQLFVSDTGVRGSLSSSVEDMPIEQFLDYATSSVGTTYRRIGHRTYFVGSVLPRDPSFPRISKTISYQANYVNIDRLRSLMPRWTSEYVTFSAVEPYMTITAPTVFIDEIFRIVSVIDKPDTQIGIHALVTELTEEATRALGLTWSAGSSRTTLSAEGIATLPHGLNQFTASHAESDTGFVQQFGATTTIGRFTHEGLLTLNSLLASGQAKIRVDTAIVTQNGQEARLQFGREQFFKIETGTVAFPRIDLERIESGVTLTVKPQIVKTATSQ